MYLSLKEINIKKENKMSRFKDYLNEETEDLKENKRRRQGYKVVSLPIVTPDNDCCWDGKSPCDHFDSEGGHYTCDLGFWINKQSKEGYPLKPLECQKLV